jgi:hypothetical protein
MAIGKCQFRNGKSLQKKVAVVDLFDFGCLELIQCNDLIHNMRIVFALEWKNKAVVHQDLTMDAIEKKVQGCKPTGLHM